MQQQINNKRLITIHNTQSQIYQQQTTQNYIKNILRIKGKDLFDNYLQEICKKSTSKPKARKINKHQKDKNIKNIKIQQTVYSVYNLIQLPISTNLQKKISTNNLIAKQLMKSKYCIENKFNEKLMKSQENQQNQFFYYKDLEKTQKINKKILDLFLKEGQTVNQNNSGTNFKRQFIQKQNHTLFKQRIEKEVERQIQIKFRQQGDLALSTKQLNFFTMKTKKKFLDRLNEKLIIFKGQVRRNGQKKIFYNELESVKNSFIYELISQIQVQAIQSPQKRCSMLINYFKFIVKSKLPQFLEHSIPLLYSENNHQKFIRAQTQKIFKQKISGRLIYKYQQKVDEIKVKKIKFKTYEDQNQNKIKNKIDQLKQYLNKNTKKEKQIKLKEKQIESKKLNEQKIENNIISSKYYTVTSKRKGFDNIHIPLLKSKQFVQYSEALKLLKPPANKKIAQQPNINLIQTLEEFKYSKNFKKNPSIIPNNLSKMSQNSNHFLESRRIYCVHPNTPQPLEFPNNKHKSKQYSSYEQQQQVSEVTISQQKTVKKSRHQNIGSSILRKQDSFNCINFFEQNIQNNRGKQFTNNFYPIKHENLIIESRESIYLLYNCKKIPIKNLLVTFLIDRLQHGVNDVYLVTTSLKPEQITLTESQTLKSMIKIICSVGGHLKGIKQQVQCQQMKQNTKTITDIMICHKFFHHLNYTQIIQALSIDQMSDY